MNSVYFYGVVLMAVTAVCFGQPCFPDQWEGFENTHNAYTYLGPPGYIVEFGQVSFDYTNQRTSKRVGYMKYDTQERHSFHVVTHFGTNGKIYVADEGDNKCFVKSITHNLEQLCLPEHAELTNETPEVNGGKLQYYFVMGDIANSTITIAILNNIFSAVIEEVTGQNWRGDASGLPGLDDETSPESIQYMNIVSGIREASVFDIPALCQQTHGSFVDAYMVGDHFVFGV